MITDEKTLAKFVEHLPPEAHAKLKIIVGHGGVGKPGLKELNRKCFEAGLMKDKGYRSWSDVTLAVGAYLKMCPKWTPEWVAEFMMTDVACNQHIMGLGDKESKHRAIERALNHSFETPQSVVARTTGIDWRDTKPETQIPTPTIRNTILALENVGITARRDVFHHMTLAECGGISHAISDGEVTDGAIRTISIKLDERFGLDFGEMNTRRAIEFIANENQFDPVLDMLEEAQGAWDKSERLETFAINYLNCADTPLNRYIGKLMLVAAVRRARVPGCKCDYIFTLLSEEGWNKSGFFEAMAGSENFSDERTFGLDSKNAQEQLTGVWFHENSELHGMSAADVDGVTAYASRTEDRARPAYGHVLERRKRRSIEGASTNSMTFLKKPTGNRRWLVLELLKSIDLDAIRRDRLQLFGEAAALEATGMSIMLPEELWPDARVMQERYREKEPAEDRLAHIPETVQLEDHTTHVVTSTRTTAAWNG